jgi:succinate dehydrogenase hydrophobic anchor subunit
MLLHVATKAEVPVRMRMVAVAHDRSGRDIQSHDAIQGSVMTRLCDLGLGVVLPFHAHVGMNAVISDYVPYAYRSAPSQAEMY